MGVGRNWAGARARPFRVRFVSLELSHSSQKTTRMGHRPAFLEATVSLSLVACVCARAHASARAQRLHKAAGLLEIDFDLLRREHRIC